MQRSLMQPAPIYGAPPSTLSGDPSQFNPPRQMPGMDGHVREHRPSYTPPSVGGFVQENRPSYTPPPVHVMEHRPSYTPLPAGTVLPTPQMGAMTNAAQHGQTIIHHHQAGPMYNAPPVMSHAPYAPPLHHVMPNNPSYVPPVVMGQTGQVIDGMATSVHQPIAMHAMHAPHMEMQPGAHFLPQGQHIMPGMPVGMPMHQGQLMAGPGGMLMSGAPPSVLGIPHGMMMQPGMSHHFGAHAPPMMIQQMQGHPGIPPHMLGGSQPFPGMSPTIFQQPHTQFNAVPAGVNSAA